MNAFAGELIDFLFSFFFICFFSNIVVYSPK